MKVLLNMGMEKVILRGRLDHLASLKPISGGRKEAEGVVEKRPRVPEEWTPFWARRSASSVPGIPSCDRDLEEANSVIGPKRGKVLLSKYHQLVSYWCGRAKDQ